MITYCEDHGNSIVVFEGRDCPACREIAEKDSKISDLENQVEKLEEAIEEATV